MKNYMKIYTVWFFVCVEKLYLVSMRLEPLRKSHGQTTHREAIFVYTHTVPTPCINKFDLILLNCDGLHKIIMIYCCLNRN